MRARAGAATILVAAVAAGDLLVYPLIRLRVATIVMLLAGAAALWSARHTRWRRTVPVALLALAGTVAAWIPLALLRAPDDGSGRAEAQGLAAGVAVALAIAALSRGRHRGLVALRGGWAIGLALSSVVGAIELVTDAHLWVDPTLSWAADHRTIIAGAFRNPNDFAVALVAMISGTLALAWTTRRRPARAGLIVLAALGACGVVLTQSRSGLLTLVVVLAIHSLVLLRRRLRVLPLLGVGAAVTVLVALSLAVPALAEHNPVWRAIRATGEPGTARSDQLRLDLLRAALRYFDASDGLGTGSASFEVLLARDPAPGVATRTWLHNSFVELLLQYGVIVTAVLGAVMLVVVITLARPVVGRRVGPASVGCPASTPRSVAVARAEALSALVAFAALGAASATVLTTPIWWLMLGQACASAWWLDVTGERDPRARRIAAPIGAETPTGRSEDGIPRPTS